MGISILTFRIPGLMILTLRKKLISEIDNSDWLGRGLLYQRLFETRYNFTGLCHGTKSVILQKYFNQFWYSSTGIGNNIYPLLSECPWDLHFIGGTNFYAWGEISGHNFSEPIYMVDFDKEVNNKYEFQECLDKWRKF